MGEQNFAVTYRCWLCGKTSADESELCFPRPAHSPSRARPLGFEPGVIYDGLARCRTHQRAPDGLIRTGRLTLRKRRGRPRKSGARHPSGDIKRQAITPRVIAAGMPHRQGLGDKAADQRAETVLGRLVLRGEIDAALGLAGETYYALWRGYVMSIAGPAELGAGTGHGFTCDGCPDPELKKYCRCWFRRRVYEEARRVLLGEGSAILSTVTWVVIHNQPLLRAFEIEPLTIGLGALARHFGLTPRQTGVLGNAASEISSPA